MDELSRVLESVRCEGGRFLDAAMAAPWSFACGDGQHRAVRGRPVAAARIGLCHVVAGRVRARSEDSATTADAAPGEMLIFLGTERMVFGSDPKLAPRGELEDLVGDIGAPSPDPADVGATPAHGETEPTHGRVVLGSIACDPSMARALLQTLPALLHLRIDDADGRGGDAVMRELLRIGVVESRAARAGVESLLARLSEMILVEALRRYASQETGEGSAWLAAARDPRIGRALALMHADPGRAWTLDALARAVALSRSALADRFARLVGQPPMRYLTRWRLALAAKTLRSGAEAMVRIAERAGYDSDAAFSRAFQREFGVPPSRWRRRASP